MNSCRKGKIGEREWRDVLRSEGYLKARRGQQFSGSPDSPDVVCEELAGLHFEVKRVEKLNVRAAMEQAAEDCGCKVPVIAHRTNRGEWLVTMRAPDWFRILRGDIPTPSISAGTFRPVGMPE